VGYAGDLPILRRYRRHVQRAGAAVRETLLRAARAW
jgi:hypothetical protein